LSDHPGALLVQYIRRVLGGLSKNQGRHERAEPSDPPTLLHLLTDRRLHNPQTESSLIENITKDLFQASELRRGEHPLFRSLNLFDPILIKSEFLGISSENNERIVDTRFHLYAVLREARGWSTHDPADMNMIVRDLLWVRLTGEPVQEFSGEIIGVYVSTIDNTCFYVTRVERQGSNNITLSFKSSDGKHDASPYISLIMASGSRDGPPLQVSEGVLSGFALADSNLAAWKCVLVRPDPGLWQFLPQLRTILAQANLNNLGQVYGACVDTSAVGVYYSEALRQRQPELQSRRERFRRLIVGDTDMPGDPGHAFGTFISAELNKILVDELRDIETLGMDFSALRADEVAERISEVLNRFVEAKWHLIDPAQIVMIKKYEDTGRRPGMPTERDRDARALLAIQPIAVYRRKHR
jgi:hypothetical protein